MTDKEKAKAYDEAIKRAKQLYVDGMPQISRNTTEYIFPELKESEDERIREEIIDFIYDKTNTYELREKSNSWLAWLEKQGKHQPADKMQVSKELYEYIRNTCACIDDALSSESLTDINNYLSMAEHSANSAFNMIEKHSGITELSEEEQNRFAKGILTRCALSFIDYLDTHKYEGKMCVSNGECEDIENAFHNAMWDKLFRYYCQYVLKQREHDNSNIKDYNRIDPHFRKPIDNVEPKFCEGEWVVQGDNIMKIRCVGDTYYCFETVGGYVDDMLVSEIDSQFHLWTIQDAKDGDVLYSKKHNLLWLHKDLKQCYSCINLNYNNISISTDIIIPKDVYPATKEQRDLLFQKMKNAGYEWDEKKKELKLLITNGGDFFESVNCK